MAQTSYQGYETNRSPGMLSPFISRIGELNRQPSAQIVWTRHRILRVTKPLTVVGLVLVRINEGRRARGFVMPLERNYRLRSEMLQLLKEEDWLPDRGTMRDWMTKKNLRGTAGVEFSRLRRGDPITEGMAHCVTYFMRDGRYGNAAVREHVANKPFKESLGSLFEYVGEPWEYELPATSNDPTGGGLYYFSGWLMDAIRELLSGAVVVDSDKVFYDPETGPDDYARHIYTEIGYSETSDLNLKLRPEEAYEHGNTFMDNDVALNRELAMLGMRTNKHCLRYAVNRSDERVGTSLVLPLTEDAWRATLDEEINPYNGYRHCHVQETSNKLFLASLAEVYDQAPKRSKQATALRRHVMIHALLTQIALLLDGSKREKLCLIAIEIIKSNANRLKNVVFEHVWRDPGNEAPRPMNVVAFNTDDEDEVEGLAKQTMSAMVWRLHDRLLKRGLVR